MTDEINHTARFIEMLNSVYSDENSEDFTPALDDALSVEHDWVIRLDERLKAANLHIQELEAAGKMNDRTGKIDNVIYDQLIEFIENVAHGPVGRFVHTPDKVIMFQMREASELLKMIDRQSAS